MLRQFVVSTYLPIYTMRIKVSDLAIRSAWQFSWLFLTHKHTAAILDDLNFIWIISSVFHWYNFCFHIPLIGKVMFRQFSYPNLIFGKLLQMINSKKYFHGNKLFRYNKIFTFLNRKIYTTNYNSQLKSVVIRSTNFLLSNFQKYFHVEIISKFKNYGST